MVKKKVTVHDLRKLAESGKKAVYLTAYDYCFARLAEESGVDMLLVGDSLAMVVLGYPDTLSVTMDEMISHAKAVRRGSPNCFVVGDMPFGSYQISDQYAVENAIRFIKAGCDAVKLEGGERMADRVRAITSAGILVQGHIGLTPHSMAQQGGYRVQVKTSESLDRLEADIVALRNSGAFSVLVEAVPPSVGNRLREIAKIPVYGIGAGPEIDGQLVIVHDILGLYDRFQPKFVEVYENIGLLIQQALENYAKDVRDGQFPPKHCWYSEEAKKALVIDGTQPEYGN